MSDLAIGLLSALLATNQPQAVSNVIQQQTGIAVPIEDQNDPTERELRNLMIADDAALDEVNSWVSTNHIPRTDTNALFALRTKIRQRFDEVGQGYEKFLREHPYSARGFLAYGSFLNDTGDEDGAKVQYENSKQIDPQNPAVWNQLANYYGEYGGLSNAFAFYAEAIRLDPSEPVYYQNLATTVYLFRKDAREFYGITERQVFDKALGLYQQAMKLAPDNLVLATDYAESYYGIKPMRTNDALAAWTNAFNICKDENEREGVLIHLARVKIATGNFDEAQAHLDAVTNQAYAELKQRLERSLADHKNPPTNAAPEPAATALTNQPPLPANGVVAPTNPPAASPPAGAGATNNPPASPDAIKMSAAPPGLREPKPQ
jgi:cytochrome c-type biogenesis protein CcmH/NrfG